MKGITAEVRATGVGLASILLWAALAVLTVLARGLPPFELLTLAFLVAALAGGALLAVRGRVALAHLSQPWAAWLTAFGGIFFYHALYFIALTSAPAAQANLINYLWPLLIVLLAAATGSGLQARHVIGALFGLAGTALILLGPSQATPDRSHLSGYCAALGCAVVWASYSVFNRRFRQVPSAMLVGVCAAVALAGGLCHLALESTVWPGPGQALAILMIGLGPTGLAFLAWDHATKHGNLPLLGTLSYLTPLASTLLLIAAGEAAAPGRLMISALLVISGAVLAAGLPWLRR